MNLGTTQLFITHGPGVGWSKDCGVCDMLYNIADKGESKEKILLFVACE